MAKVDLKITVHLQGDSPEYKEMSIEDMMVSLDDIITSLDDIITELLPDNNIQYKAQMENLVCGTKVEKSN